MVLCYIVFKSIVMLWALSSGAPGYWVGIKAGVTNCRLVSQGQDQGDDDDVGDDHDHNIDVDVGSPLQLLPYLR